MGTLTLFEINGGTAFSTPAYRTVGPAVEFVPTGASFATAVAVTVPFDPTLLPLGRTAALVVLRRDGASGAVTVLPQTALNGNLVSATTTSFSTFMAAVSAGPPVTLAFKTVPASATAGAPFATAVEVEELDAAGALVGGASDAITLSIGANPGNGSLTGTTTVTAAGGVAAFPGLTIDRAGSGYTLVASATGLAGATSAPFDMSLAQLAPVSGDGQAAPVTTTLARPLVVSVTDSGGAPIAGVGVSFFITSGGGSVQPATAVTNAQGLAQATWTLGQTAGPSTVIASAPGVAGPQATFHATATAGPATRLTFLVQPPNGMTGIALNPGPAVAALDQYGNVVTDGSVTITLGLSANPGGATLGGTTSRPSFGQVTFGDLTIDKAANGYTLAATSPSIVGATSAPFDVVVATPLRLALAAGDGQTAPVTATLAQPLVVSVKDAGGAPVAGVSVTFSVGAGGGSVQPATAVTNAQGLAQTAWTLGQTAGALTVVASAGSVAGPPATFHATATAGPATALAFVVQPQNTYAGIPLYPGPVVAALDQYGNVVTDGSVTITLSLSTNPGGATLGGTTSQRSFGQVGFASLTINKAASGYTLAATAPQIAGATSAPFDVAPGVPFQLAFVSQPTTTAVNQAISPPVQVALLDRFGNSVPNATAPVTIALFGSGTLSGTFTVPAVGGVATFSDLRVDRAGVGDRLGASSPGFLNSTNSNGFTVTGGPPAALAFVQQPVNVPPRSAIPIQVAVLDASGALVTTSNDTVTITIGSNPGNGTLAGTKSVNAVNGTATFSDFSIDQLGSGYTLVASASNVTPATSAPFSVIAAGAPARVYFTGRFYDVTAGAVLPSFSAGIYNTGGGLVSGSTADITLTIASGPPGATLQGTASKTAIGGVVTFNDIVLTKAGGYELAVSSPGLTSSTGNGFGVSTAAADHIALVTPPSDIAPGDPFSPPLQTAIYDRFGNLYVSPNISVALGKNPGGGSLLGFANVAPTFSTGVVTFLGLSIDRPGIGYTLVFSVVGLPGITLTSPPFNVGSPGIPARLAFRTQPSAVAAGSPIAPHVQVEVRDQLDAVVTGASTSVAIGLGANPSGGRLSGMLVVNASGGVADFGDLAVDKAGAGYTLVAEAAFVASATSAPFGVAASGATQLVFQQQPTNVAPGAPIAPAVTVALVDANGNVVPNSASITIAIGANPGGAVLSGTTTKAAVGGAATFTDLALSASGSGFTLVASASSLAATSAPFNVSGAGVPARLAFTAPPVTTNAGAGLPPIVVSVEDALGNPVSSAATIALVSTAAPGRASLYGTLAQVAPNGVATFADVTITRVGSGNRLIARSPGLTPAVSPPFDATPAAAVFDASLPKLAAPRRYPAPTALESVVAADIDGDGLPDVLAAGHRGDMVYVWQGLGIGALGVMQQFPDGMDPVDAPFPQYDPRRIVAVGDLNGDGHPDLAIGPINSGTWNTGAPQTTVAILMQDPARPRSFLPPKHIVTGTQFAGLAIGDVNGDGLGDIVISSGFPGLLGVLVILQDRNAPGTFLPAVPYSMLSFGGDVTIADVDGDGLNDIVVSGLIVASFVRQDPARPGTFLPPVDVLDARGVILADVNGDGAPDLVGMVGSENGPQKMLVSLQDPTRRGTFLASMSFDMGNYLGMVAVADWNHDGKPDLLATRTNGVLALGVALQDPLVPSFGPPQFSFAFGPGGFVLADLEQNGGNDVIGINGDGIIIASEDRAHPGTHFFGQMLVTNQLGQLAVADVNGDGKRDVVGAASGQIEALLQDPSTPFRFPGETVLAPTNGIANGLAVVDLNGDGLADLVYADRNAGTVNVRLQDRTNPGVFLAAASTPAGGANPDGIAFADVDGDGIADVLVSISGPGLALLRGSGGGGLRAATVTPNVGGGGTPAVGDFDGDGAPDVALLSNGFLWILLQDRTARGTFKPATSSPTVTYPQCPPVAVDLDGDVKLDIVVAGGGVTGSVGVHLGTGTGLFQPVAFYLPSTASYSMAVADVSGDGRPDILLAGWFAGVGILVQAPNAPGTFVEGPTYKTSYSAVSIAAGDLDGDGHIDVVAGNTNTFATDFLRNVGVSPVPTPLPAPAPVPAPPPPPPPPPSFVLKFIAQPTNVTAGQVEPPIRVAFQDLAGNTVASITSAVTIAIGINGGAMLSGTTTVQAVNGVATFADLSIATSNTTYTLVASAAPLGPVQSGAFDVSPGPPVQIVFVEQPSTASAGSPIRPAVQAAIADQFGNRVPSPGATITVSLAANPGGSTLAGTLSQPATTGTVTFSDLAVNRPGVGYTLLATGGGFSATSQPFAVQLGEPYQLAFTQQPSDATAGVLIPTFRVDVLDRGGNVVTFPVQVGLSLGANPGISVLSGSTSGAAPAVFSNVILNRPGNGYTLFAAAPSSQTPLVPATSQPFNVIAGPAVSMSITVQPTTVAPTAAISPAVQVTLFDSQGNVAVGAATPLAVALGSNPYGATLSGTLSATPLNGVATFADVHLDRTGTGYTLRLSCSGLADVVSTQFAVSPPSAGVKLQFGVQPHDSLAGLPFVVSVAVVDSVGNRVPGAMDSITLALGSNPTGAVLGGTTARSATNGLATFPGLTVTAPGTGYTIAAVASGLAGATSASFRVLAAPEVSALLLPAGTLQGTVSVSYALTQAQGERASVVVEYLAGGGNWTLATQAGADPGPGHEGTEGLATTTAAPGAPHVFLWNSAADLPGSAPTVQVRVTAHIRALFGLPQVSGTIVVANSPATRSDISFSAPRFVPLQNSLGPMASGDLNLDGIPDLVVASAGSSLTVLLGRGNGDFIATTLTPPQQLQGGVAIADVNRDGFPDVILSTSSSLLVYVGNGTGSLGNPIVTGGAAGGALVVADVDGDGRLDVVAADLVVLLGNGDGTFQSPTPYRAGNSPVSVAVGDINNDGNPDVVVGNYYSEDVWIFLGTGLHGGLAPPRTISLATHGTIIASMTAVALVDVNGDGNLDLLVPWWDNSAALNQSGRIGVLLGDSTGTFGAPTYFPTNGQWPRAFTVGDVNRDGVPDVVATNQNQQPTSHQSAPYAVALLLGNGTGGFGAPTIAGAFGGSISPVLADFDGDGVLDVAIVEGGVAVLHGSPNGTFQGVPELAPITGASVVALGKLHGPSGNLDLVAGTGASVTVFPGAGNGTFGTGTSYALAPGGSAVGLELGDLDGDGMPDVVIANWGDSTAGAISVLLNDGAGGLLAPTTLAAASQPLKLGLADVDGDGKLDIICLVTAQSGARQIFLYLGNGNGTFTAGTTITPPHYPQCMTIADVNSDGRLDLVIGADLGIVDVFLGNGNGTFANPTSLQVTNTGRISSVAVGDVNGDGIADLVATPSPSYLTSSALVLLGTGQMGFGPATPYTVGIEPAAVRIADVNGDGKPDLVGTSGAGGDVAVLLGDGTGVFGRATCFAAGVYVDGFVMSDLDGDARADLIVAGGGSGAAVLLGR